VCARACRARCAPRPGMPLRACMAVPPWLASQRYQLECQLGARHALLQALRHRQSARRAEASCVSTVPSCCMQAAPPPAAAAGASEAPSAGDGPAAAAGAGGREAGSFGASMHAQALARRRAMGDDPRPRAARPGLQAQGLAWAL